MSIDPVVVRLVSSFLTTQESSCKGRYDDAGVTVMARGFLPEHPAFAEEVEHEEDHWSHIGNQWATLRTSWEIANT